MFGRRREDRRKKNTIMAVKFKSMAALALSAAMLLSMAACGTTDSADSSASAS